MIGLNIGSGQRRFKSVGGGGYPNDDFIWCNIDCVGRPPDQVPDMICDVGKESLPFGPNEIDYVVLHQVYEHFGLGEGYGVIREAYRVLKPGGSLIVTVPDMKALAQRWMTGQIDDYIYMVNVYGAYQGQPGDRHAWGFNASSLSKDLACAVNGYWERIWRFNNREIPGADIAKDWWILGIEAVK